MKTITLDIHPALRNVTFTVKSGRAFTNDLVSGRGKSYMVTPTEESLKRMREFAVAYGDDKNSNHGDWYAHCNGFAMDLCVFGRKDYAFINTYRPYGRAEKKESSL